LYGQASAGPICSDAKFASGSGLFAHLAAAFSGILERPGQRSENARRAKVLRKRTLREWEELWRKKWDINDDAELDTVFANTEAYKDVLCEVEIRIMTRDGRIDIAEISLLDDQGTVLAGYEYTMLELGRVELEQEVIAPLNLWPEDEEDETASESPASSS
jgi:hypothetical protein